MRIDEATSQMLEQLGYMQGEILKNRWDLIERCDRVKRLWSCSIGSRTSIVEEVIS